MKQPIKPEEIRKGDLIRFEWEGPKDGHATATEYVSPEDEFRWGPVSNLGQHYLLDRPVPPFEPYWGMMIAYPYTEEQAIYLPDDGKDTHPWVTTTDHYFTDDWESDEWALARLAEGWVIITKPEGVK